MKKTKITFGISLFVILSIALAGMYKFNYLANQPGYDVDGNKIASPDYEVCDEKGKRYPNNDAALEAGLEYAQFGATYCREYKMHPSWDANKDGLNDCENDSSCDDSVDYSQPRHTNKTNYEGLSTEAAQKMAESNKVAFRVVMKDGQSLPATMDYRSGRINATIENDKVVSYKVEGQEKTTPQKSDYIGLTIKEAEALAQSKGVPFRIVNKDGKMLPTTRDFRIGRINATVENDKVVSYEVEGGK